MKAFLDCMIYLHYRPIEELDLPVVLNSDSVIIVIPRITLRELDNHKNTHQSRKVRDRARRILKKIEEWASGESSVCQGVSIELFTVVPTNSYEEHGLNPQWSDDVLIASILEYAKMHTNEQIILITQDSALRLMARQLDIHAEELPEDMKLPEELDPLEIENRELSKIIDRLRNALPQLTVCFAGSDVSETHARFSLTPLPDSVEDEIARKIDELRSKLPKQYPSKVTASAPRDSLSALREQFLVQKNLDLIPPEEYDRYNSEVDTYLKEYEKYMRDTLEQNAAPSRTIHFQIEIRNTGSAPADDVDIMLYFPNGFTLMAEEDLPDLPKEPLPPREPRSQMEILKDNIGCIPNLTRSFPTIPDFKMLLTSFRIERTGSYRVTDHFERIKHGAVVQLPEMFLTFDSYEIVSSFHCDYTLRLANLPDPVEGKLHFIIEKKDANKAIDSNEV